MSQAFPLATLASLPDPVLTVYLDTNPLRRLNRNLEHGCIGWFSRNAKRLLAAADNSEYGNLSAAIKRVERFLGDNLPEEQGIVLFAGPHIWQPFHLPNEPENELHWGKPMLWQLAAMNNRHRPWCVVTVDRSGAHLFSFHLGELTQLDTMEFHLDPSHWKRMQAFHTGERQAGMSYGPQRDLFERRCDANFARFLGDVAHRITHASESLGLKQVLLFGPSRYTRIVEHDLPSTLRKQAIHKPHLWHGWNSSSLSASTLKEELRGFELDGQERHVGELLNGRRAVVTGSRETLAMLQRGRLGMLMVEEGFNPAVGCCTTCGYVSASCTLDCPHCQGTLASCNLHEILPELLVRHSCESEFLNGAAAQHLRAAGSIGGWLRQRQPITVPEHLLHQQTTPWLTPGTA